VQRLYVDIALLAAVLVAMALVSTQRAMLEWLFVAVLVTSVLDDMNARKAAKKYATDWSAAVTGLLLAFCLASRTPWWVAFIGAVVAISLGKEIFGGLGFNIFNPALVARAILLMSWPAFLTTTVFKSLEIDAGTTATPLALAKDKLIKSTAAYYEPLLLKNIAGCLGEVSAVLILAGGIFLIVKGIIDWRIPGGYLASVAIMSVILKVDPAFSILAGGIMLGAFFMATDYVTSCSSPTGKIVFGVGCGLITMVLRHYSGASEAVTGAILFMNMMAPLIDRSMRPKMYGEVKA